MINERMRGLFGLDCPIEGFKRPKEEWSSVQLSDRKVQTAKKGAKQCPTVR
ncbi:hypothetical protein [Gracilibacillus salinarum]|uniref:Transposase n=1 Tax=Gracilibacillus salinarum TaxID=2932255 RepID=A0ABY4GSD7_9BACI|nr:hypothetical protein [Gracilibacillus salinarum]UOQ87060.1 hypothetical protein MUN87_09330 [Gracilibacillus salinarum]